MSDIEDIGSMDLWQKATQARREEVCQIILNRLPKRFKLVKPYKSVNPSNGQEIEIPCFYDERYETALNLVFEGEFPYGASDERLEEIERLFSEDDWAGISPLIRRRKSGGAERVSAFLMSRFPVYEWVVEENIDLDEDIERPDFYSEDGPYPVYVTSDEAAAFLKKSGYRLPADKEWEYVAKEGKNNIFICGSHVPEEGELESVCLAQFGDARKNRDASNLLGIAGLGVASFTVNGPERNELTIRGGAAGFYPFQHPSQIAMLLSELQLPPSNMPGGLAGLRLCLDVPGV